MTSEVLSKVSSEGTGHLPSRLSSHIKRGSFILTTYMTSNVISKKTFLHEWYMTSIVLPLDLQWLCKMVAFAYSFNALFLQPFWKALIIFARPPQKQRKKSWHISRNYSQSFPWHLALFNLWGERWHPWCNSAIEPEKEKLRNLSETERKVKASKLQKVPQKSIQRFLGFFGFSEASPKKSLRRKKYSIKM